jgi:Uncharacterized protein conserved in bacteria (DUF2320).
MGRQIAFHPRGRPRIFEARLLGARVVSSETRRTNGSLALYYRPGAALRLGVAGRVNRTRTPSALLDPATGTYEPNTATGRNVDLLVDYEFSSLLSTNARVSYTRQTNSNITGADFSGLTGGLGVRWQPTAKIAVRLDASRDAGLENTPQRVMRLCRRERDWC